MNDTIVITDCRIPKKAASELANLGFDIVRLPPFEKLASPVASHPDMLLFINDDIMICHKEYFNIARDEIEYIKASTSLKLILSDEPIGKDYPNDILFNSAKVGNFIIGNTKYTSAYISEYSKSNMLTQINVKQGYAKCSTCIVSNNAIVTSDPAIAAAACRFGIDVLKISEGYIGLHGYTHGFIGGASGIDNGTDRIFFCGDLFSHPDGEKIFAFCKSHKKTPISLSDENLYDVGTLFFIQK